jgi:hypothetical protein
MRQEWQYDLQPPDRNIRSSSCDWGRPGRYLCLYIHTYIYTYIQRYKLGYIIVMHYKERDIQT